MSQSNSVLKYLPELEQLPLIIAGPILRHVQTDEVTVWLALKKPDTVTLKIHETEGGNGSILEETVLSGERETIALGQNLHVVAVTAVPIADKALKSGYVYAYNLYFHSAKLSLAQAINSEQQFEISYFAHQLPTFALSPQNLNSVRIVHGSCRKPHGGGKDILSCLDNLIQEAATVADERPHQLFMTGDQIYGDDVADVLLWLIQGVNQLLWGWTEELPLKQGSILSNELPPGQRTEIARIEGGMTAMLGGKDDKAKSHLFSFVEYAAAYLLAWSPVLIPNHIPSSKVMGLSGASAKAWQEEVNQTESLWRNLSSVRRALANIAVYTICDDHDVSDDWYLNREWCDRVLGKPLGKRIVQNGLLAYAIFQGWGNTPQHFAPGTAGEKLLSLAAQWLESQGQDHSIKTKCDRYLGIPQDNPEGELPQYQLDQDVLILQKSSEAIPWHYTVMAASHEVLVIDTRNWRGYPQRSDRKLEPPMLLSPMAFEQQLVQPLEDKPSHIAATLVVLPTNLVALGIIDRIQQYELSRDRVFSTDVGDSWNFHESAFITLLLNLCRNRDRVIILSGDIHYSCAVRIVHWNHQTHETSIIVQLTSSAIKNSELSTRIIHTKLKSLLPESTERWFGWNQSQQKIKVRSPKWWQRQAPQHSHREPDWQYRIEWIKRQPAKALPWRLNNNTKSKTSFFDRIINGILALLWRNPWLQEGSEVVGRNNLSLVRFNWTEHKRTVIQETYWNPPWKEIGMVKSKYEVPLDDNLNSPDK
ncbi:MAG: PhoD-like phosphatase [Cyanobacteria bacterium P01_G01_bin.39]